MAESPEESRPTEYPGERPGLGIVTRYGLTLEPSPELNEFITAFIRPEAARRVYGRQAIRFGIAQHNIEVNHADRNSANQLKELAKFNGIEKRYEKTQLGLYRERSAYKQIRDRSGAFTYLSFELATSSMARSGIMRAPFFDNADHALRAHVVFPNEVVAANADEQASALEEAMLAEHPNAIKGLAHSGLFFSGIKVIGRERLPEPRLRVVRPGDET